VRSFNLNSVIGDFKLCFKKHKGNEYGETVVEERVVRISAFPTADFRNASVTPSSTVERPVEKIDANALAGLTAMRGYDILLN